MVISMKGGMRMFSFVLTHPGPCSEGGSGGLSPPVAAPVFRLLRLIFSLI